MRAQSEMANHQAYISKLRLSGWWNRFILDWGCWPLAAELILLLRECLS